MMFVVGDEDDVIVADVEMEEKELEVAKFTCPYHFCHTCTDMSKVRKCEEYFFI